MNKEQIEKAFKSGGEIEYALRSIAGGHASGPSGLEFLAMALASPAGGELRHPVGEALDNIASSISEHASAIENLAEQIEALLHRR